MKKYRKWFLYATLAALVLAGISSCGNSTQMYKHKRSTDCGC